MTNITEKTAPNVSVDVDKGQPSQKCTATIITAENENFNSLDDFQREMISMLDPHYLKTVSMTELYDTVYQSKPPLIDGLLYPGTYIFAGAPKLVVRVFLWLSLPIISARVYRFGIMPPEKERCFILLLKMITEDCRNACIGCLCRECR